MNEWWFPVSCGGMTEDRCGFCCELLAVGRNCTSANYKKGKKVCRSCEVQSMTAYSLQKVGTKNRRSLTGPMQSLVQDLRYKARKQGLDPVGKEDLHRFINHCLQSGCECCGAALSLDTTVNALNRLQVDQLIPRGGYVLGNMCGLCSTCNRLKQDHTLETAQRLVRSSKAKPTNSAGILNTTDSSLSSPAE